MSENIDLDAPVKEEEKSETNLPEGEYRFCVKKMDITQSKGKETLGAVMIKLELLIYALSDESHENGKGIAFDNLIRHKKTDWRVAQFFKAIGERKSGQTINPPWNMVTGSVGRAILFPDSYQGKVSMKVREYIDPAKPILKNQVQKPAEPAQNF